jgi:SAM-dependent methyltransferase
MELLEKFVETMRSRRKARVLELGTQRSIPTRPTHHRDWCAPDASFVMSDMTPGLDVDVIADIHSLSEVFTPDSFDFCIACSVFEHLQRPWIAMLEIARVLRRDGQLFVQTHQSFPLHGYPNDYWRFTQDALRTIGEDAGMKTIASGYEFPARVVSEEDPAIADGRAFLNVCMVLQKPAKWQKPKTAAEMQEILRSPLKTSKHLLRLLRNRARF